MLIASVVADANVLLSAAVGKAALRVFTKFRVTVHVVQFNADEVAEYLPYMASKYELSQELVEMQWKLLPLHVHSMEKYRSQLPQAMADLKDRDPEDAHVWPWREHWLYHSGRTTGICVDKELSVTPPPASYVCLRTKQNSLPEC